MEITSNIKDPEDILPIRVHYSHCVPDGVTISDATVTVLDAVDNDITSGIVVAGSKLINNITKTLSFRIQGGSENAILRITVLCTLSDGSKYEDKIRFLSKKRYDYFSKTPSEIIPHEVDYSNRLPSDVSISSFTVKSYVNDSLVSYIQNETKENTTIKFQVLGGSTDDRIEVVVKAVLSDASVFVNRMYVDIR